MRSVVSFVRNLKNVNCFFFLVWFGLVLLENVGKENCKFEYLKHAL